MKNKVMILAFVVLILGFVLCACDNEMGPQDVEVNFYKPSARFPPSVRTDNSGRIVFISYSVATDRKPNLYHEGELFMRTWEGNMFKIGSGQNFVFPNGSNGNLEPSPAGGINLYYERIDFNDSKYSSNTTYYFGVRISCTNNNGSVTYSDILWETTGFTKDW